MYLQDFFQKILQIVVKKFPCTNSLRNCTKSSLNFFRFLISCFEELFSSRDLLKFFRRFFQKFHYGFCRKSSRTFSSIFPSELLTELFQKFIQKIFDKFIKGIQSFQRYLSKKFLQKFLEELRKNP